MKKSSFIFPLFGYDDFANAVHHALGYKIGTLTMHQFPDEETVIRIGTPINQAQIIFIGSLNQPNTKLVPLLFAAETARELGATRIGLIAPYLAYMRQDKPFHSGEGITSKYFARIISDCFDWMITIDPHLHRWHSLSDLYSIPTTTLHATESIACWIKQNVLDPVLIGPDVESAQWVARVAEKINSPFLILEKKRKSDNVESIYPTNRFIQRSHPSFNRRYYFYSRYHDTNNKAFKFVKNKSCYLHWCSRNICR